MISSNILCRKYQFILQYQTTNSQNYRSNWKRERQKQNGVPQSNFFHNAFRCILKYNIDKNFTKHNYVRFGDLSHGITVCLILTTRSPHYNGWCPMLLTLPTSWKIKLEQWFFHYWYFILLYLFGRKFFIFPFDSRPPSSSSWCHLCPSKLFS